MRFLFLFDDNIWQQYNITCTFVSLFLIIVFHQLIFRSVPGIKTSETASFSFENPRYHSNFQRLEISDTKAIVTIFLLFLFCCWLTHLSDVLQTVVDETDRLSQIRPIQCLAYAALVTDCICWLIAGQQADLRIWSPQIWRLSLHVIVRVGLLIMHSIDYTHSVCYTLPWSYSKPKARFQITTVVKSPKQPLQLLLCRDLSRCVHDVYSVSCCR